MLFLSGSPEISGLFELGRTLKLDQLMLILDIYLLFFTVYCSLTNDLVTLGL